MERVQSFKTSDEKLHTDEGDALKHELFLTIRGLINNAERGSAAVPSTDPATKAAAYLARHPEALNAVMSKYKRDMGNFYRRNKKAKAKATA